MPPMHPLAGMAIILGAFLLLWIALALFRKLRNPNPEILRKLMHVGMGLVTLLLPALFDRAWPVVLLASICALALAAAKFWPPLGAVIGGVDRASRGDLYFPISVAILFIAANHTTTPLLHGRAILFCIPILILTFADAIAALVGISYGAHRYTGIESQKSAEGSLAFFTVAFLSTHIPLLLLTDDRQMVREKVLLISLTIGFLVMLLEGIAWRGLDNLLVPLGAFILLNKYIGLSPRDLSIRFIVAFGWVFLVLMWRRLSSLNAAALLGAALVGYIASALGGWIWVIPPMLLFVSYNSIFPRTEMDRTHAHTMHGVLATNLPGLLWLLVASGLSEPDARPFFWPYALTYAAHLAIIGFMRLRHVHPGVQPVAHFLRSIMISWLVLFIPSTIAFIAWYWPVDHYIAAAQAQLALVGIALALFLFTRTEPKLESMPTDTARWLRQALYATAGSLLTLAFFYFQRN
jgi:phytol kinase